LSKRIPSVTSSSVVMDLPSSREMTPFPTDFIHSAGNHLAHFLVVTRRDGTDLGNGLRIFYGSGMLGNLIHQESGGLIDAALEGNGVGTSSDITQTLLSRWRGPEQ
jgi:hypothetical protein